MIFPVLERHVPITYTIGLQVWRHNQCLECLLTLYTYHIVQISIMHIFYSKPSPPLKRISQCPSFYSTSAETTFSSAPAPTPLASHRSMSGWILDATTMVGPDISCYTDYLIKSTKHSPPLVLELDLVRAKTLLLPHGTAGLFGRRLRGGGDLWAKGL